MKMVRRVAFTLFAIVTLLIACSPNNPFAPPPADNYLNEMIDVMQANHVNKDNIDWVALRAAVLKKAEGVQTIAGANEAVLLALELLDDKNSFVLTALGDIIEYRVPCTDTEPPAVTVPADIGYIKIPPYSNFGINAAIFAEKMHGEIRDQDRADLKGWIIDLRENTGGNLWPMIAGIGPVLGDGTIGFFVKSSGTKTPFGYKSGSATYDDEAIVTVSFPYAPLLSVSSKVAILVDHSTTNAGEAVAVAFSGRVNTRSFGATTCGQGGGSQPFQLSDRSVLYLSVAFLIDRNEKNFQGEIQPDEVFTDRALIFDAAVDWINQ